MNLHSLVARELPFIDNNGFQSSSELVVQSVSKK